MVPSFDRESGISKIVNASPEDETRLLKHFAEKLKNQEFQQYEREKTPAEREIIETALHHFPEFIKGYGGIPVKDISTETIHLVDRGKLTPKQVAELDAGGWYIFHLQQAVVLPHHASLLKTAEGIVH